MSEMAVKDRPILGGLLGLFRKNSKTDNRRENEYCGSCDNRTVIKLSLSNIDSRKEEKMLENEFNSISNLTLCADYRKKAAVIIARRQITEYEISSIASRCGVVVKSAEFI
ncbi:hypothetical protein MUJ63_00705 [Lachnospiraceae bacterium NSJ-143]|nr:hypothetical protein [Lachnospiraceae bacterium NSJ-143]